MRRGMRGGTRRPPLERPGNGYGRDVRPGPVPGMRHGERPGLDELVAMLLADDRAAWPEGPRAGEIREGNGAV